MSKAIPIGNRRSPSPEAFAMVDDEDAELAEGFRWSMNGAGYAKAYRRGAGRHGPDKFVLLHRIILGLPPDDDRFVDHIDRNPLNCRRSNLRIVTKAENCQNCRVKSNSSSGVRGVFWDKAKQKWAARVSVSGKLVLSKRFAKMEDAALAVQEARRIYQPFSQEATFSQPSSQTGA